MLRSMAVTERELVSFSSFNSARVESRLRFIVKLTERLEIADENVISIVQLDTGLEMGM